MSHKADFEKIYEKPAQAIWTLPEPPQKLIELVESGVLKPCKLLDSACGEGTAAIYLARKGFAVTGIDFSPKAIAYAKENAAKQNAAVDFKVHDSLALETLSEAFDAVFEWGLLHHLDPKDVPAYITKVSEALNPGGLYITNSFNIESTVYGTAGDATRRTPIGTELHYYSQEAMRNMFTKYFKILEEEIVPLVGQKGISQPGNFFLLQRAS